MRHRTRLGDLLESLALRLAGAMRGEVPAQPNFVSLINVETTIAADHPIRVIKRMCDEVLREMSAHFDAIYVANGAPSIPPETPLKAKVLQAR